MSVRRGIGRGAVIAGRRNRQPRQQRGVPLFRHLNGSGVLLLQPDWRDFRLLPGAAGGPSATDPRAGTGIAAGIAVDGCVSPK